MRAAAGTNVEFVGRTDAEKLRDLLRETRAFVFAAEEDFGIMPVESQACGTPVMAYGRGGALETVRPPSADAPTGLLFPEQSAAAIAAAIVAFDAIAGTFTAAACRANAEQFASARFRAEFARFMTETERGRALADNAYMNRSLLKPFAPQFALTLRAGDPVVALGVGLVVYVAYLNEFPMPEHYVLFLVAAFVAIMAIFPFFRLYEPRRGASIADELRRLLLAWVTLGLLVGITIFATKSGNAYSRVWVSAWLVGSFIATSAMRVLLRLALQALRKRGHNLRHITVVGAGVLGRQIAERLRRSAWVGLNVVGYYDDDPEKVGTTIDGRPVQGPIDRLFTKDAWTGIDQVWIALPLRAEARIRMLLTALRDSPVEVRFVPDIYSFHLLNHSFTEIAGLPVISLTETPMVGANRLLKWMEDRVLGALTLLLVAPAMILIAPGVKLTSSGPALYRQERMTWNGQCFQILKFRTMPVDAEALGPVWPQEGARRATRFGAFLRRFSLDELPQLFNVLKGEMSLVGPRPERPELVARFRQEIAGYMQKHLVKAGITGWAQVNDLRGDSDLIRRIEYDLYYIDHWSLWFDLRILALTLWNILTSRHAS